MVYYALVDEDRTRGQSRTDFADAASESGWVTTEVAARAVRVSPRTIRRYIDQGKLEAKPQGEGVRREWLVSVDSLHALRASRTAEEDVPEDDRSGEYADSIADVLREMAARLERRAEEAAELRVRLELTAHAQSTLEEELAEVRRERDELRRELEARREPRESPETASVAPDRGTASEARAGSRTPSVDSEPLSATYPEDSRVFLAPVDKLPWWHYVLGISLVFVATYLSPALNNALEESTLRRYDWYRSVVLLLLFAQLWAFPGVFGFWVGFRLRNPILWSQIIPFGALVGVVTLLGPAFYFFVLPGGYSSSYYLGNVGITIGLTLLPGWLLYVSASLIGNAWQRRRTGRISDTTPASPISRTTRTSAQPREDWTPRKQAILGWSGTIISALLTLIGTIITVRGGG
jgi:hypothetical protein